MNDYINLLNDLYSSLFGDSSSEHDDNVVAEVPYIELSSEPA